MQLVNKVIAFDTIVAGLNVRLTNRYDLPGLSADIADNGLIEPLKVWNHTDALMEVITGHRRLAAIAQLQEHNTEAFDKHFADGVPCVVVSEVTADEVLDLKIDDGNKLIANDPHEIQRAASFLFEVGNTEAKVAVRLRGLIESTSPIKGKVLDELNGLEASLAKAMDDGNPTRVAEIQSAIDKRIADYFRGRVQNLHNAYRSPFIVMAALNAAATGGERLEGFEDADLPSKLSTAQVTALYKAHEKDMQDLDGDHLPKFNKGVPGPEFKAKWVEIIKADGKETPKKTSPKSMSSKDIMTEVTSGEYRSKGFQLLAKKHARDGEVSTEAIKDADTLLYYTELVQLESPDMVLDIIDEGKAVELVMAENVEPAEG